MVAPHQPAVPEPRRDTAYYEQLQEQWPAERPSRKRARGKRERRITVRAERLEQPDTARMSRALLAAERELAAAKAEAEARHHGDVEEAEQ